MNITRKNLSRDFPLVVNDIDTNQVASLVGAIGEQHLCRTYGWEKIDADGYDAIAQETIVKSIPGYIGDILDSKEVRIEIKTMCNESKSNILAYTQSKKDGNYDYLAIYMYDEERVAIIPHDIFVNTISKKGVGKTINLNPSPKVVFGRVTNTINYSPLTKLFLEYEDKEFKDKVNLG